MMQTRITLHAQKIRSGELKGFYEGFLKIAHYVDGLKPMIITEKTQIARLTRAEAKKDVKRLYDNHL